MIQSIIILFKKPEIPSKDRFPQWIINLIGYTSSLDNLDEHWSVFIVEMFEGMNNLLYNNRILSWMWHPNINKLALSGNIRRLRKDFKQRIIIWGILLMNFHLFIDNFLIPFGLCVLWGFLQKRAFQIPSVVTKLPRVATWPPSSDENESIEEGSNLREICLQMAFLLMTNHMW